jgi:NAD(P)-dependent dehydrogenase (short-subunit alcohol dehydrogenase family)
VLRTSAGDIHANTVVVATGRSAPEPARRGRDASGIGVGEDAAIVAGRAAVRPHPPRAGTARLLVNNAWSGYEISPEPSLAFWEIEWRHWDLMFAGGLRAAAFASTLAAPMMIAAGTG